MKKEWLISLIIVVLMISAGCGTAAKEVEKVKGEESKAKVGDEQEYLNEESEAKGKGEEDSEHWTKYDVKWEEDYKELKFEIKSIGITEELPEIQDDGTEKPSPALAAHFIIDNTTNDIFTTYPDQAQLVTSQESK
ncbi:hypothetical protein [Desmospora activa]|uniref:hypothetical protein n=1 Tax=Desmospora activa TaxID=500615 RepID=UPI000D3124F4|nr:hypothetical protein [Desmospora activa]